MPNTRPVICRVCGGYMRLTVQDGRWGPSMLAECETCHGAIPNYRGPGAWEAIMAAVQEKVRRPE